ncbi:hypothetical protein ACFVRD_41790 [Streptomyces sp. NPDC057908]|uniref:hypothetical protein n=1 Tax=Streptomyces sp. NPDC057908 TaxID=3346276 RepID=UPI0036ED9D0F
MSAVLSPEEAIDLLIERNEERMVKLRAACKSLRAAHDRSARAHQQLADILADRHRGADALAAEILVMADHMAELEAETAKLIRWHHEDGAALAKTQRAVDHLADRYRGAEAAIERARKLATQWAVLRAYGSAATELRTALGQPQQPTSISPTAALLATDCDACRHTLNWHRNDVGCTVPLCVCSQFQQPTA